MEEINMTNIEAFKVEFTKALQGRDLDDLETQTRLKEHTKERLAEINWEREARIETSLVSMLDRLGFTLRKFPEVGLALDYGDLKSEFERRLQHDISICICSESVHQGVQELLLFSQENEWNDEIIISILDSGYKILSSYFAQYGR
jgi:hypothetical protein